jgi:3-hydroxyacyl-CoA dehydrogenase
LQYFRPEHDETIMNRDRLLPRAIALLGELAPNYQPPQPPQGQLASASLSDKMAEFMHAGIDKGDFMPHDKTTAMAIASVMVRADGDGAEADEDAFYARERAAFIRLAKTAPTHQRICSMLDDGAPVRN